MNEPKSLAQRVVVSALAAAFALAACTSQPSPTGTPSIGATASLAPSASVPAVSPGDGATQPPTPSELPSATASTEPSASPATPSPSSTATASPTVDGLLVDWQEQSSDLGGMNEFWASAAVPSRFVAVGNSDNAGAGIWTSTDGLHWRPANVPDAAGYTSITLTDVTAGGPGAAAVADGRQGAQEVGVVYVASDGRDWTLAESPDFAGWQFMRIGSTASSLVVFGSAWPHGAIFASTDGINWQQATGSDTDGIAAGLLTLERHGSQLWAFSEDLSGGPGSQGKTQVWTTNDGLAWQLAGALPGSLGVTHLSVAAGPLGWVAVGANSTDWLAWRSSDGLSWSRVQPAPWGRLDATIGDQAGFVAVGWYSTRRDGCVLGDNSTKGVTWTSSDGSVWREMADNGWKAKQVDLLRRDGRTLFGLGLDYTTNGQGPGAVWTALLPGSSQDINPPPAYPPPPYDPDALDCTI